MMKQSISSFRQGRPSSLGASIAALRREMNMRQQDCCDALARYGVHITPAALSRWENGSNLPSCCQLLALSHVLGQKGRVSRFASPVPVPNRPDRLADTAARALSGCLLQEETREAAVRRPRLISFPVAENYASAGTGYPLEEDAFSLASLPASGIPPRADFAVRISGDSMEPRYHDGQLVFVEKTSQLYDGEIGLFSLDGEGYIKQYREILTAPEEPADEFAGDLPSRSISLISCNPRYRPIRVPSHAFFMILGRIL